MTGGINDGSVLFERYKVVRVLGRGGGSSTVYLAENIRVGNLVAIKVVSKDASDFNLLAEKDILKELRHPSIPIIMDIHEDDSGIYLVEEYVEGGTSLKQLKLQVTEDEALDIMKGLVDVLDYLHTSHNEPIIYRDLKPDNIIRMQNGHIKLVDFGIAKRFKKDQLNDTVVLGTRGYAAPEQYGMAKADVRTDIYSLGVCIYYLLTGGKNLSTPPYKLMPLTVEVPGIDAEFAKIIERCIQTVPTKRYQNIHFLKEALHKLEETQTSTRDYQIFNEKASKVIRVLGLKQGLGTSHIALMLSSYYQQQGYNVAAVEFHNSEDFSKISLVGGEDTLEGRHSFTYKNIEFYPFHYYGGFEKHMKSDYDVIVVDAGSMDRDGSYEQAGNMDTLLVCGSKEWEIDLFEDYYFARPDLSYHYLFNFTSDEAFMSLSKSLTNMKCYQVPYNPGPYQSVMR